MLKSAVWKKVRVRQKTLLHMYTLANIHEMRNVLSVTDLFHRDKVYFFLFCSLTESKCLDPGK